jgi:hypothetical protein
MLNGRALARENASRAISTRLAASSRWRTKMPVTLPPGRERLATYLDVTGSKSMASNTIGFPAAAIIVGVRGLWS